MLQRIGERRSFIFKKINLAVSTRLCYVRLATAQAPTDTLSRWQSGYLDIHVGVLSDIQIRH